MMKRLGDYCFAATTPSTHHCRGLYIFLTFLLVVVFPFTPGKSDNVPASAKYKEVTSVSGSVGQIPCPVTSFDDVVMILWFKGASGAPIYSYDARNEEAEPRHMTLKDDWGLRLYFRVWPNNRRHPALMIQELKPKDSGLYRCRVDYRNSPTTNSVTRLKIIEPPTRLEIRDTSPSRPISDQQMMMSGSSKHSDPTVTYMGPYSEGQNVTLVCSAYGGRPLPEVRWYKNGDMVDTSYSLSGTEYTINEMTINNLGRNHTLDVYSCQANNNNETQALTHKVHLEIYLGVTSVELEIPSPMTAGSEYNIFCRTVGAYPTVKVELWKNLKRIASRSQMKSMADNATVTSILYKPEVGDDGTIIICKAENPWVSRKPSVARKTMKIKYAPVTVLRLGRNRTTAFSEGESVLMECHVKANPPAHTIMWFHQGRQLGSSNETVGIRINGMTLFISYLTHQIGGDFNCEAVNDIGKGISNTLPIELHLSPKCVTSEAAQVPLAIGETQWLTCNILAWPSDLNFYWTLNRSDSTRNGKIRGSGTTFRNLTEYYRLPISTVGIVAAGINSNVTTTTNTTRSDVSISETKVKKDEDAVVVVEKAEQHSPNQFGYPQLSSGSSSDSLDYPEDQHVPPHDVPSKNAMMDNMERTGSGSPLLAMRTTFGKKESKEKRSSQKDILFEKTYSTGEKAILKKEEQESSINHSDSTSLSDVVFSMSRDATSPSYNFNRSKLSFSASKKLTSNIGTKSNSSNLVAVEKEDKTKKAKRHVYPSSTSSHFGIVEGKTRGADGNAHGFQDKIRHRSLIPYHVKSDEDYGTVACFATNSFGSQVFPCLFHIIKKDEGAEAGKSSKDRMHKSNSKAVGSSSAFDRKHTATFGNLTAASVSTAASTRTAKGKDVLENELEDSGKLGNGDPSQRGFSKLHKTLGVVLLFILIFIAGLSGLAFALLFLLARGRREIRRIVITHGPRTGRSRPNSNNGSIASNNKNNTTNINGKGATSTDGDDDVAVNKNAPSENAYTFIGEEKGDGGFGAGFAASTFLPPDMMFAVAVSTKSKNIFSTDPFQESEAEDTENKEKPQLPYISTDTTTLDGKAAAARNNVGCCPIISVIAPTTISSPNCLFATNKKGIDGGFLANNTGKEATEKDIARPFPQAFLYLSRTRDSDNNNGCCLQEPTSLPLDELPLQAQFVDQITEGGFRSVTANGVGLVENATRTPDGIGSNDYGGSAGKHLAAHNDCNNLNSFNDCSNVVSGSLAGEDVGDNLCLEEHHSHLDRDLLLQPLNENNVMQN